MLTDTYHLIDPKTISVDRAARQRQEDFKVDDLVASIRAVGHIMNPLVISPSGELVAGERRLRAALEMELPLVPVRYTTELSPSEHQLLELEENVRRKDLSWQDRARAMARMFSLFQVSNPGASQTEFGNSIGYSQAYVSTNLSAAEKLEVKPELAKLPTLQKAANVVQREEKRAQENLLADVLDSVSKSSGPEPQSIRSSGDDILCESFLDWAPQYTGPKFNLLHCDFPYGIDLDQSDQLQAGLVEHERLRTYQDSEDLYWSLLRCLCDNAQRLLSSSCHFVFWYSLKHTTPDGVDLTRRFLHENLPELVLDPHPLIWHKTDNRGIAPDVERRPRHVYELALFGRIGDRKNVKLVSDAYGAPKSNGPHPSEKPVPVLRHFLSMVVDSHTRMLDPTCGSGSSLRAAESLGATSVTGLEIDPEFASLARSELERDRKLRLASGGK